MYLGQVDNAIVKFYRSEPAPTDGRRAQFVFEVVVGGDFLCDGTLDVAYEDWVEQVLHLKEKLKESLKK